MRDTIDLASADCGGGKLAGGDRLGGPGRQVPVEAGPGDSGLGDDLGDGVPGGAQVGGVVELVPRQATLALLIVSARRTTLRRTGSVWWVLRQIR